MMAICSFSLAIFTCSEELISDNLLLVTLQTDLEELSWTLCGLPSKL